MSRFFGACVLAVLVLPTLASAQPPVEWELKQNDPNPFCGITMIEFAAPVAAVVSLVVFNPPETGVVRTLFEGSIAAGFYTVAWDQRDDDGALLPSGAYPYELEAFDPTDSSQLFSDKLTAIVECIPTPTRESTWSRIKAKYR